MLSESETRKARSRIIAAVEKKWVLHTRLRVHAYMWVPGRVGMCMRMRTCSLAYPAINA